MLISDKSSAFPASHILPAARRRPPKTKSRVTLGAIFLRLPPSSLSLSFSIPFPNSSSSRRLEVSDSPLLSLQVARGGRDRACLPAARRARMPVCPPSTPISEKRATRTYN